MYHVNSLFPYSCVNVVMINTNGAGFSAMSGLVLQALIILIVATGKKEEGYKRCGMVIVLEACSVLFFFLLLPDIK